MRKYFLLVTAIVFSALCFSQGVQKVPGNSRIIYFGDSQTSFGYNTGGNSVQFQNYGYIAWVNALCPGVYMPKGGMLGVAGETTNQMLNRVGVIQNLGARVIVVMAGTNDPLYGIAPATTQSNLRKVYNAAIAAGMRVIAVTIMPRFSPNAYNATNESNRRLINNWIKSQTDVSVVDVENDVNDPIYFIDGLHNSPLGAYVVGNKIATEINRIVVQCQPGTATEAQLTVANGTNPLMAGSTGKKDNAFGIIANNWQLAGKFAGGATVTGSKEVDASGREKQVIDISGAYTSTVNANGSLSTPKATFNNYVSSPIALTSGDVVHGVAEIEITAPMTGVSHIYLNVQGYTADFTTIVTQGYSMWPTSAKSNYMPPGKYVLRTPPMTVASNNTVGQLTTQIIIEMIPTSTLDPVSANLKITSIGVMKLPLADGPLATITPSGSPSVCPGAPVQLSTAAGNGYSYQWSLDGNKLKDSTASTLFAKDPGSYTVTIKTTGCTAVSDAVAVVQGTNCPATGIQTGALPAVLCAGQKLTIPFSTTGLFEPGNSFTAQLSDGQGSFANPITIGSSATGGSVLAQLPVNLTPDLGYRIRVVGSNPTIIGNDNGQNIKISVPVKPSVSPSGTVTTYPNLPATLATTPQENYSYQWLVDGVKITQGGTGSAIVPTASGQYRVILTSPEGCFDTSLATVVNLVPCNTITINQVSTDTTQFSFTATGGTPPYQFVLDNGSYQTQNTFFGFQSSRTYSILVKDSVNCTARLVFTTKAAQAISFGSLGYKLTTDAPFDLTAAASSGLPVAFRVISGPAIVIDNHIILTGGEGEVVVEASQTGNGGFYAAPAITQRFFVIAQSASKNDQTVTFNPLADRTFGDAPFILTATATSGLPVSYRVVSGPATLSGDVLTITGTGTVSIEASQIGNNSFNPAPPITLRFNVNAASQVISFDPLPNRVFGDASFALMAKASSALPVSYRVVSGPATITGVLVTMTGAGTVSLEASQAGNANYAAATPVTQVFSVARAGQTLSFASIANKTFGDAPFTLNATTTSGLPVSFRVVSGPVSLSGNTASITGVGDVSLEAAQQGDDNYLAATPVVQTFTVSKAPQIINFASNDNKQYGDAPFALTATASSGLPVGLAIISGPAVLSGNTLTVTGTGLVTVEASQGGSETFNAAAPVRQAISVGKASQAISFAALAGRVYGEAPFALAATASSGLPVFYRVASGPASIAGNMVTLTGPGTVVIEATQSGDVNYSPATPVLRSFTTTTASSSSKQAQTITFGTLGYQTCANPPFALAATASSGLPVSYRVVSGPITIAGNIVTMTGAGTATIEAMQPGDATYNPATPVQRSFNIGKGSQTISFTAPANKSFGDAPFALAATASSGLPVSYRVVSGPATITGGILTIMGIGTVTVEATQPGDANFNTAFAIQRSFSVVKGSQAITFPAIPNKYNTDGPFTLAASASSNLPVIYRILSGPATVSNNVVTLQGIGNVTIEASQPGDANYNAATAVSRSFTIVAVQSAGSKFSQTITFDPVPNKTFGDPAFALNATASSSLPVAYQVISGPATISFNNVVTITGAGLVSILASQSGDVNYNPAPPVSQTFTVNKQNQVISFTTVPGKAYGDPAFALTATATSGLPVSFKVASGPATITGNVVSLTGAGWVTLEASQVGDANYNAAVPVGQSFFVSSPNSKQPQTVSFGTLAYKTYGSGPFELTATASSGLPVSYRVVTGPITISGTTVTITGVGSATIEASQPGDASFSAAVPVQRSFTIAKGSQSISFSPPASKTFGDAPFALTATATSGLPVNFRIVSGPATISGNVVTLTGTGTVSIEASQPGDANWNAANTQTRNIPVTSQLASLRSTFFVGDEKLLREAGSSTPQDRMVVYPNPVTTKATIRITVAKPASGWLALYTAQGAMIRNFGYRKFEKGQPATIDFTVHDLAGGVYVLRFVTSKKALAQEIDVLK